MGWINPQTGQRYTDKEADALQRRYQGAGMEEEVARSASADAFTSPDNLRNPPHEIPPKQFAEQVYGGAKHSLKRTYLGAKQAGTYALGNEEDRQRVNREISQQDTEDAPILDSAGGKIGDFLGTTAQFLVPGAIASKVGKALPAVTYAVRTVTGAPGSVGRAAVTSGAYEALQPVNTGGATDTEQYLTGKAASVGLGALGGAAAGKVANIITNPGRTVPAERAALVKEAENQGYREGAALTPAQRFGADDLWSYEKKLRIQPGSADVMAQRRAAQQAIPDQEAVRAMRLNGKGRPDKEALLLAGQRANEFYEPLKQVGAFPVDAQFTADMRALAEGSPDIIPNVDRLLKRLPTMDGKQFMSELQRLRNDLQDAWKGGGANRNKADDLKALHKLFEDYGERSVQDLAANGLANPKAVDLMKQGRLDWATIHNIEPAVKAETESLDARKFLRQQERRRPASAGAGNSPLDMRLQPVREVSETWRGIQPPPELAKTSGTPEGLLSLKMGNVASNYAPSGRFEEIKNWLARREAEKYLKHGGRGTFLGERLTPSQNAMVRRLLPPMAIGAEEAVTD